MKKYAMLILTLTSILGCNKSNKIKQVEITFDYVANITQTQCLDSSDSYKAIYFDIYEPGKGRVSRTAQYNLNTSSSLELEMGEGLVPHFCSSVGCTEEDYKHYQVGKTYEWKIYLICACSAIGECGSDFVYLNDGTDSPVKLLSSGSITLDKKKENNHVSVTLNY